MIVIVDYGMGNLRSILMKLLKLKIAAKISHQLDEINNADKLILPGVGHFYTGMENLLKNNLIPILEKKVLVGKTPILGICLGMQLLTKHSEEGNVDGLGWLNAYTKKFDFSKIKSNIKLRIPHIGWNNIKIKKDSILFKDIDISKRYYFVHSYAVKSENAKDILTTTFHGYEITSAFQKENIYGTQFHPEKSHQTGLKMIENFAKFA